ncbi:hypothetical protein ACKKBF_B35960 [Auxenochlorella protothecoides x Auxenochlorella symbiontica]
MSGLVGGVGPHLVHQERAEYSLARKHALRARHADALHRCIARRRDTRGAGRRGVPACAMDAGLSRELARASGPQDALHLLAAGEAGPLTTDACRQAMQACVDAGRADLARGVHAEMLRGGSREEGPQWPAADAETSAALLCMLCRAGQVKAALGALQDVRTCSLGRSGDVQFGHVVPSPLDPELPLALVRTLEATQNVADAASRYEFQIVSGTVTETAVEAVAQRRGTLWASTGGRVLGARPGLASVHRLVLEDAAGRRRALRFGTTDDALPAKAGDVVSVACCPERAVLSKDRLFKAMPPNAKPGQPMLLSNQTSGKSTPLVPAPPTADGSILRSSVPGWVLPAFMGLAAFDTAAAALNPGAALAATGAAAALGAAGLATQRLLLPRLRKLPSSGLAAQEVRQGLLAQHLELERRIAAILESAADTVQSCARLHHLRSKMAGLEGTYTTRLERVKASLQWLESRLEKQTELLRAAVRVLAMVEVEVELQEGSELEARSSGIEEELTRLDEIDRLQQGWWERSAAEDEVEKLLQTS